jgi:hypothetical protein
VLYIGSDPSLAFRDLVNSTSSLWQRAQVFTRPSCPVMSYITHPNSSPPPPFLTLPSTGPVCLLPTPGVLFSLHLLILSLLFSLRSNILPFSPTLSLCIRKIRTSLASNRAPSLIHPSYRSRFSFRTSGDVQGSGGNTSIDSSTFNYVPGQHSSVHTPQIDFNVDVSLFTSVASFADAFRPERPFVTIPVSLPPIGAIQCARSMESPVSIARLSST